MQKIPQSREWKPSEAQMLLMKAHALYGEIEALFLGLTDEEFETTGATEGDWAPPQIVEHMAAVEKMYREEILRLVEQGRSGSPD